MKGESTMLRKVRVENGLVRGLPAADPRITSFKGIPFAAPPVGENRWRAPQPASDWDGELKAYEFAPISMQAIPGVNKEDIYSREWHVDPEIPMDEDCLYLNVWTPAKDANENLPVFVWFFGGGLQVGYPSEMEFDGERIACRGAIVVTVNYRLNVFGFLCHSGITAECSESPANFGHLDQQAGIHWVKRNISAFGGDPDNITIGGQSAGGGSVLSQLVSPQNEGLFQKAIIQSGIITMIYEGERKPGPRTNLAEAERDGAKFFDFLGVSSLEEARQLDAKFIRDKALEYNHFWGTVIDNKFNVGDGFNLFLENRRLMVPVLLGHTSSEFFSTPNASNIDEFKEMAVDMFGDDADEFLELCDVASGDLDNILEKASINSIEYAIRVVGEANADTGANTPLYYYNFDVEIPGWDNPGAFHSIDLWFTFETLAKCWRPFVGKHYDVARQICNYWTNFIRSGNPNGKDSTGEDMPQWDVYRPEAPYGMLFKDEAEFVKEQPGDLMEFLVKQHFKKNKKAE